jgi:hypothetical protein
MVNSRRRLPLSLAAPALASTLLASCSPAESPPASPTGLPVSNADPAAFVRDAEALWLDLAIETERADWVQANFITVDTNALAAAARERQIAAQVELAELAAGFDASAADPVVARKLRALVTSIDLPAPADPALQAELARRALRRAGQRRRARAGLRRPRRDVALQVRHAGRRLRRRARPALGAGAAALRRAALPRARRLAERYGESVVARPPDPGAPAGQHVGAELGKRLRPGGAAGGDPATT